MRYFAGYKVSGDAALYYTQAGEGLAREFGLRNLSLSIPPHVTLKAPFETENRAQLEALLLTIARETEPMPLVIDGLGSAELESCTVFLSVQDNTPLFATMERIADVLAPFGEGRQQLPRPIVPHVSVARHLAPEQVEKVLAFLNERYPEPRFVCQFDHLALFSHTGSGWNTEAQFPFAQ